MCEKEKEESGMVTAEFAIGSLSVSVLLAVIIAFVHVGIQYVGASEAARNAARVAALGEGEKEIVAAAQHSLPDAAVKISRSGRLLRIEVKAPSRGLKELLGMDVVAESSIVLEPEINGNDTDR